MGRLPERVQVYPTENYYYFRFLHDGVRYDGNIRLAAEARDRGELNFSFNEQITDWNDNPRGGHAVLGAAQGVAVEKLAPLLYRVSVGGKAVTFALNDLSASSRRLDFSPPTRATSGRASTSSASASSWCSTRG